MATSQASTAAAVGRASRLDTRDHLATLAGKELALGIGTIGPRSRIADGLSAHAYRADALRRYNVLVLCTGSAPKYRSNPCRSTGEAGLDHPPRPNSGGHLVIAARSTHLGQGASWALPRRPHFSEGSEKFLIHTT